MSDSRTPTQLADHVACAHLTPLQRQQREGALSIEFAPDPRLEALRLRGHQHEDAYVERLRAEGLTVCDLRDPADDRAGRDPASTLTAMRAGFDVIVVASPRLLEPDCRTPEQMAWANGFCRFAEAAVRVAMPR